MATIIADTFKKVNAGHGPALAAARIEGPVMGFARNGVKTEIVRPDDKVVARSGAQLFPAPKL